MILIRFAKNIKRCYVDYIAGNWQNIRYFNSKLGGDINSEFIKNSWFVHFIRFKQIDYKSKKLYFFGVYGNPISICLIKSKYKIFYSFENVHAQQSYWNKYENYLLNNKRVNLSIGFDYIQNKKYVRFPYWIFTMFQPTDSTQTIKTIIDNIENEKIKTFDRNKFCAFICREDYYGDRSKFADMISKIGEINFPGNFKHNDFELKTLYNDNKFEYLKQFKFNLCPENSDFKGYVTEKIFDAVRSGCIPIYWGSDNCPEPEILNSNRILFLNLHGDNSDVLCKIKYLNENQKAYIDFINQPIFQPNATTVIYDFFNNLEEKLREIVY